MESDILAGAPDQDVRTMNQGSDIEVLHLSKSESPTDAFVYDNNTSNGTVHQDKTSSNSEVQDTIPAPIATSPKVRHRVEYRSLKDDTLLYTKDETDGDGTKKLKTVHEGPVFDVVDVNYTSETKDTQKSGQNSDKSDGSANPNMDPSVRFGGKQYIRIYSRSIVNALQSVVNYYPYRTVVGHPIDIYEPYAILVHHWDLLEQFREQFNPNNTNFEVGDCEVSDTYEHLGYLLSFMEMEMRGKVNNEYERWKQPVPKASFEMLWLLLAPGADVYCDEDDNGSKEPWVVSHVTFNVLNKSWNQYEVTLWQLVGDEDSLQPEEEKFTISRFHGEKPIQDLDVFPCQYYTDNEKKRKEMIDRGKLFFSLRQKRCMYYDGEGDQWPRLPYKGYVMVDPVQQQDTLQLGALGTPEAVDQKPSVLPLCSCTRCLSMESERTRPAKFDGYKKIEMKKVTELTEHQYFICTRSTWAFVLGIREWKLLFLEGFTEPKWDLGLIDSLVLKRHYKDMLQNLSRMFIEQQQSISHNPAEHKETSNTRVVPWTADYVENKGKGLVFLLHGKPGVGKTYTAECIAHQVQRPLLSVTCADIGVEPTEVEANLNKWFKIARRWDAIMLLDEADIYMEYRQIHDLTRNNLVAGFLRAIEYYDGVLFLTTNRIGTFDEAFLSRITAIYYDDFNDDDRKKIWGNYFEKLEQERGKEIYVPRSTKEYATDSTDVKELQWNGREIRNAFQIAVNLAQAEGVKDKNGQIVVKEKHIEVTVELSKDFKRYMSSLRQKTDSERARLAGIRNDEFNVPPVMGSELI
ncbi:hypothetical protein BKA66DRAFT_466882 [Pyrenochaeta sp. MPI-SDFR-AT-0127]|nr:hypothetical protein BKA66DRAFT_466882 [Pyrenochaeta sp. MPI-SDFR-AT-0127]